MCTNEKKKKKMCPAHGCTLFSSRFMDVDDSWKVGETAGCQHDFPGLTLKNYGFGPTYLPIKFAFPSVTTLATSLRLYKPCQHYCEDRAYRYLKTDPRLSNENYLCVELKACIFHAALW